MIDSIRKAVEYDPKTGLFRRIDGCPYALRGWFAGYPNQKSHLSFRINGKQYKAHRVAWLLSYGAWPEGQIDHRDHDPSNNRLNNLRDATNGQNQHNRLQNTGKGLPKGVRSDRRWPAKFYAAIKFHGKQKHLATFDTAQEAARAYQNAARELHGEFAYSKPGGKDDR